MIETKQPFYLDSFVSVEALDDQSILTLIERALEYKKGTRDMDFSDKYAVNCFFEDSTRTHKSFEMAERKLGMNVLSFDPTTSSVNKGETLYDTLLTLQAIGVDLFVIRHKEVEYYKELIESNSLKAAIVNGGDGAGQHPSQCLLDLMTIYEEFGRFEDLNIAIAGDLRHSRVARSNMQMLNRLGANIFFTGPKQWYDSAFDAYGVYQEMDDLISTVDVMMLLRVQHERHDKTKERFLEEEYLQQYGLTQERENRMRNHSIIMHPAPFNRDVEISGELVECERSRIFNQMENGVYARMAIIEAVLANK